MLGVEDLNDTWKILEVLSIFIDHGTTHKSLEGTIVKDVNVMRGWMFRHA